MKIVIVCSYDVTSTEICRVEFYSVCYQKSDNGQRRSDLFITSMIANQNEFWTILYDRYIPTQTFIITLLRNVLLKVPKGA